MDRAACCVCFLSVWKSWSAWVDVVVLDSLQARDAQRQHTVHCSGQAAPQHKEFCNCVAAAGRDWAGPGWPGRSNTTPQRAAAVWKLERRVAHTHQHFPTTLPSSNSSNQQPTTIKKNENFPQMETFCYCFLLPIFTDRRTTINPLIK